MKFNHAIVNQPCQNLVNGLTSADLGYPDFTNALKQHDQYVRSLRACGLKVEVLAADEQHPDSTFVEDAALLTPGCAIVMRPAEVPRRGETAQIVPVLEKHYSNIEKITAPGTIEGGDIMMVADHYYIGLSARTNLAGAEQLISILNQFGLNGSVVTMQEMLHLKTGLAYLENNVLLACGEFLSKPEFQTFDMIEIPEDEAYAANCIWVNDKVLVPSGYPKTSQLIADAGYELINVDVSEFRKLDGGLSCLSLRF